MKKLLILGLIMIMPLVSISCSSKGGNTENVSNEKQNVEKAESGDSEKASSEKFPKLVSKDFDGNEVDTDELFSKNDLTAVNMWFTGCMPCVSEMPYLQEVDSNLMARSDKKMRVIGICTDLNYKDGPTVRALDIIKNAEVNYTNLIVDLKDSTTNNFISTFQTYPTTIFVDKDGNIVGKPVVGAMKSKDDVQKFIDNMDEIIYSEK